MKHTKKALVSASLALLLCFAMLVGTTFAWFTDSVTSANNIIKSGKLNIDLGIKAAGDADYVSVKTNPDKKAFNYELWEPGYTEWVNAKVFTTGNLALKYTMKIVAEGTVSELADVIDVYYAPLQVAKPADRDLSGLTRIGTLRDALNGTVVINDTLIPDTNTEDFATLALHMQESAGNEYQDKSIGTSFSLQILATQFTKEQDSFDENYDADAKLPIVAQSADELVNAINMVEDGGTVVMDADLGNRIININNGKEFTLDLAGNDLAVLKIWDGDVTLKNGHIGYPGYQGVSLNGDNSKVTVGKDVTITGEWGVTMFGKHNVADIYGTINSNVFVSGNVQEGDSVVNIYGTINNTEGDVGVALNGHATVNIKDGAVITGKTGIEVRAGNLNVYGGTITGTGSPVTVTPNGSGTTSTGAGIAVAQHTTKLPINVNITGGTISGYSALYESNPQNNADADLDKITINVTGGTFSTINGGTVKYSIADEAVHYTNTVN